MMQTDHDALRAAALGCISVMLTGEGEVVERLSKYGASKALHTLASSVVFGVEDRIKASRSLQDAHENATSHTSGAERNATAPSGMATVTELDHLMVSLLSDAAPQMRSFACRGVARAAQRGRLTGHLLVIRTE